MEKSAFVGELEQRLKATKKDEDKYRSKYLHAKEKREHLEGLIRIEGGRKPTQQGSVTPVPTSDVRSSPLKDACLAIINETPGNIRVHDVEEKLKDKKIEFGGGSVSYTLKRLADTGKASKVSYGVYKRLDVAVNQK